MRIPSAIVPLAILVAIIGGGIVAARAPHMLNAPVHDELTLAAPSGVQIAGHPQPRWAVDPGQPGTNLPPAGRSLLDFALATERDGAASHDIPFPFEALIRRIQERGGCDDADAPCMRQVLIPLGRSLQRTAAAPDFFAYPRVVVAFDREGKAHAADGLMLKDRLYLGYQEKADLIEAISYNEAAGRFEFQLVKDYRAGGTPRVVYASRMVCMSCHQNGAPLFSRQQWDETNANPQVAALLERTAARVHGFPARRGIEVPNAIDDAVHRANLLPVYQMLWRQACGEHDPEARQCKLAALTAALQYGLSGERSFDTRATAFRRAVLPLLQNAAAVRWREGLAIPNPEVPNRDALRFAQGETGVAMTHVSAAFEPLAPRAPLEVWYAGAEMTNRFVAGLAQFFSAQDWRALDEKLRLRSADVVEATARCRLNIGGDIVRFHCFPTGAIGASIDGRITTRGGRVESGLIDTLAVAGTQPLPLLDVDQGTLERSADVSTLRFAATADGRNARLPDGNAVERIELRWRGAQFADATVAVRQDFAPLREALGALAADASAPAPWLKEPFARASVMAALDAALQSVQTARCCLDTSRLPPAVENSEAVPASQMPAAIALFERPCAACHRTPERTPANFLHGDAKRVQAALEACAPRIFVRLSMWQVSADQRAKTPMPPARAAYDGMAVEREMAAHPETISALKSATGRMLRAQSGRVPKLNELLADGYENLRPCLPPGS